MEHWFRSHHGAPMDAKYVLIAKKASTVPGVVASIWWAIMDYASQNEPRGSAAGFDCEATEAFFGYKEGLVQKVHDAIKARGLIDADGMLHSWEKRQPKRERPEDVSRERVRAHRERLKSQVTPAADDVAPCNASESQVTPREREREREETDREQPPVAPLPGGRRSAARKRRRIPDEWTPTEAHRERARQLGIDAASTAEEFRAYWKADGGVKLDWDQTFDNRLTYLSEHGGNGARGHNGRTGSDWRRDAGSRPADADPAFQ